jgi:hypothetical protein
MSPPPQIESWLMIEYDYACVQYSRIEVETIYQLFLWSAVGISVLEVFVLSFCLLTMGRCGYVLLAILYYTSLPEIRHVGRTILIS